MEEKKQAQRNLFLQQKELLGTFLAHGSITKEQYQHSLNTMATKMGIDPNTGLWTNHDTVIENEE